MLSRIYFDMAKMDLSILAKSSVNIGNPELEKVIVEYYDEIHRVINKKNNREFVYNRQQPQILMRYSELSVLVQEINDVVDIFLSEEESSRLSYKDAIHLIKIKFNKMISLIGKKYVIRKRFLKRLKAVHNYVFDENMIFKMTVCSNEFDTQRVSMFEHILYNVTKYNNKIPEIGDIDFREKIHELANYFMKTISIYGKTTVGKNVLEKYNAESGCFSIMHECGGKSYFAFSGAREYKYSAMREQFNILAENVMQKVFGVYVKNGNVRIRGNSIDWAFLTDEVLRYYPFGVGVEEKGEYISAVRLKDDLPSLNWVKDKGKVGTSYGCCERKILAFSKNNKEKIFFSRWAPCFKCRPAMEEKNIRTFALCKDFKEWKETHRYELKEYKVKKTYSVVCMLE